MTISTMVHKFVGYNICRSILYIEMVIMLNYLHTVLSTMRLGLFIVRVYQHRHSGGPCRESLPLREVLPEHQPERKWSHLLQPTATKGQQRCSKSDQCQQKMDAWNEQGSCMETS